MSADLTIDTTHINLTAQIWYEHFDEDLGTKKKQRKLSFFAMCMLQLKNILLSKHFQRQPPESCALLASEPGSLSCMAGTTRTITTDSKTGDFFVVCL